jgi:predicted TIM-barrel fold metal-dependent hydrolase
MIPMRLCVFAVAALIVSGGTLQSQQPGGRLGTAGTVVAPGADCPPGTTEVRPNRCQAPEMPAPSILDYRPRSTLVTPAHLVPRAKYPVIDFHGHLFSQLSSTESVNALAPSLDSIGVRLIIAADGVSGDRLKNTMVTISSSPAMKDRVRTMTGVSFQGVGPGWAERVIAQLEADAAAGSVGIGEINKGLGLSARKADGSRLRIDDSDLDPVWEAAGRLRLPVFIHTADPQEFFKEIDYSNERWLELALFPNRRFPQDRYPSFDQLMTERDNLLRKHPKTTFVIAHMGWHANDLARLGKLLDLPNVYTEVGAVLYDIGRQPRGAREFFIKYQDKILFGKDSFQPEEFPYYWRVFETADEYFDYYRGYHAFWKLYGIDLPDEVLKKLYYKNALKVAPRLPQAGWPR